MNIGGWHDAGDFDLRIESQIGESYILALAYEMFHPDIDATSIDQQNRVTEIHQPDGKNDILQQVENGALSVIASYKALGRLYRGIISNRLRQYVHLGDAASMTDGTAGNDDDRWIYTENNPMREIQTAAELAGVSRVPRPRTLHFQQAEQQRTKLYRRAHEALRKVDDAAGCCGTLPYHRRQGI